MLKEEQLGRYEGCINSDTEMYAIFERVKPSKGKEPVYSYRYGAVGFPASDTIELVGDGAVLQKIEVLKTLGYRRIGDAEYVPASEGYKGSLLSFHDWLKGED